MLNQSPATPKFDSCRVNYLRARIAENDYTVDTLQIADKIIDLELALSGKH
jgi:anti-sigma28 factor (negative regulator of flagellin synthesis)